MAAITMQKIKLPSAQQLKQDFPTLTFVADVEFFWSANSNTIHYNPDTLNTRHGTSQLLHEIGHALCQHTTFSSGIQLLKLESDAWEKAIEIAKKYQLTIDTEHVEQCLNSYRDWLHQRSTCPNCNNVAVETEAHVYKCFNCSQRWKVPISQKSRCYRLKQSQATYEK